MQGQILLFTQSSMALIAVGAICSLLGHSQLVRTSRESGHEPRSLERLAGVLFLAEGAFYFANLPQPAKGPDIQLVILGQLAVLAGLLNLLGRHSTSRNFTYVMPALRAGLFVWLLPSVVGLNLASADDLSPAPKASFSSVFYRLGPQLLAHRPLVYGAFFATTLLATVLVIAAKKRKPASYVVAAISFAIWAAFSVILWRTPSMIDLLKAPLH